MIQISTHLQCDRCKKWAPGSGILVAPALSREIERIRDDHHNKGWRRFRLRNTEPNSDLCPECVELVAAGREKGAKPRAER